MLHALHKVLHGAASRRLRFFGHHVAADELGRAGVADALAGGGGGGGGDADGGLLDKRPDGGDDVYGAGQDGGDGGVGLADGAEDAVGGGGYQWFFA